MKILITGGAGFIGSHTADLLLANGMKVTVFDNLSSGKLTNLDLFNPNLEFQPGDILDYPLLLKSVKNADAVLHLAALPSVQKSIEEPITTLQVNTQGFIHVLEAIRETKRNIRLVYASSAAVYGNTEKLPCDDEADLSYSTLSPYALEKANNERYADLYARLFGIQSLGLRYFNAYGTRQDPKSPYSGVIAKFLDLYNKQEPITIYGKGGQSRDFIFIDDIAKSNLLALQSEFCGSVNIATGKPETLLNLVNYLNDITNRPAEINFLPERLGDIPKSYAKVSKAQQALSFTASVSLRDGIQKLAING